MNTASVKFAFLFLLLITLSGFAQEPGPKASDFDQAPKPRITLVDLSHSQENDLHLYQGVVEVEIPPGLYQERDDEYFFLRPVMPEQWMDYQVLYSPDLSPGEYFTSERPIQLIFLGQRAEELKSFELEVHYQICDYEGICFLPQKQILQAGTFIQNDFSLLSLVFVLFMAFLGGLALNIMPCVYPLIPIKVMNLMALKEKESVAPWKASLTYGAGILVSLLGLSVFVMFIQASGSLFLWGSPFQNPYFVFFTAGMIIALSLSLFGVYTLSIPGLSGTKKQGLGGEFSSGLFAVFVAAPCTAPFFGTALSATLTMPLAITPLIFFFVGIGFALPYFLLTVIPGLIKMIPKSGKWMVYFEGFMGFILLGASLYYLRILQLQTTSDSFFLALIFLVIMAFVIWVWSKFSGPTKTFKQNLISSFLLFLALALAAFLTLDFTTEDTPQSSAAIESSELVFDPQRLLEKVNAGERVFVQVWAAWCTQCKINDDQVFSTDEVQAFFEKNKIHVMKADATKVDESILNFLKSVERAGLPVYAYYQNGQERPILLPESFSKDEFINLMEGLFF